MTVFRRANTANFVTVFRVLLVMPIGLALYHHAYGWALGLIVIAGLSDGVDGFLARHYHWQSRFGAIADPLADKLLMATCYLVLGMTGGIPVWLVVLVLGRDIVILSGVAVSHLVWGPFPVGSTWLSKICTFFQILYLAMVMSWLAGLSLPQVLIEGCGWLVAGLTLASGIHYVLLGIRRFL